MRSSRLTVQNSLQAAKNEQKRNIMKCRFPNILSKALSAMNPSTYVSMPSEFLYNLTKNLTAHLRHYLCAVLPLKQTNYHYMKQR